MDKQQKNPTSIRLTPEAKRLIERLAKNRGVTQTAILELAIREMAERYDIDRMKDSGR